MYTFIKGKYNVSKTNRMRYVKREEAKGKAKKTKEAKAKPTKKNDSNSRHSRILHAYGYSKWMYIIVYTHWDRCEALNWYTELV